MVGGSWEYVAAYIDNGDDMLDTYGSSILNADIKYKNVYAIDVADGVVGNYNLFLKQKGDALYETSVNVSDSTTGWYGDRYYIPRRDNPWFLRGCNNTYSTAAGAFSFYRYPGSVNASVGFRTVVSVGSDL